VNRPRWPACHASAHRMDGVAAEAPTGPVAARPDPVAAPAARVALPAGRVALPAGRVAPPDLPSAARAAPGAATPADRARGPYPLKQQDRRLAAWVGEGWHRDAEGWRPDPERRRQEWCGRWGRCDRPAAAVPPACWHRTPPANWCRTPPLSRVASPPPRPGECRAGACARSPPSRTQDPRSAVAARRTPSSPAGHRSGLSWPSARPASPRTPRSLPVSPARPPPPRSRALFHVKQDQGSRAPRRRRRPFPRTYRRSAPCHPCPRRMDECQHYQRSRSGPSGELFEKRWIPAHTGPPLTDPLFYARPAYGRRADEATGVRRSAAIDTPDRLKNTSSLSPSQGRRALGRSAEVSEVDDRADRRRPGGTVGRSRTTSTTVVAGSSRSAPHTRTAG
jgi:hypothetical protein